MTMEIIKSYTDIEQSRKLSEILPIETADMYRVFENNAETRVYYGKIPTAYFVCEPCWSLAALLNVMPRMSLEREKFFYNKSLYNSDYTYRVIVNKYTDNNIFGRLVNNPIDACYEMILKLHELNKL